MVPPDRVRVLGEDHPDTLRSRDNLAVVYREAGRVEEAIPLYEQALSGFERVLGKDHPTTESCRENLAAAYRKAGVTDAMTGNESNRKN